MSGVRVCGMSGKATPASVESDRMRTRAIAQYVHDNRDTLKKAIDDFEKLGKNARRNELLREGRRRFYEESGDVRDRYYTGLSGGRDAGHQHVRACGGAVSGEKQQGCGGASDAEKEQPQDPARPSLVAASSLQQQHRCGTPARKITVGLVESPPKRAKRSETHEDSSQGVEVSGRAADEQREQGCQLIKEAIYAKHSLLVTIFGDAQAADVLASSFRFLQQMRSVLQVTDIRLEIAALLGIAAKHSLCHVLKGAEKNMIKKMREKIVGTAAVPAVTEREIRLVNAWGLANK